MRASEINKTFAIARKQQLLKDGSKKHQEKTFSDPRALARKSFGGRRGRSSVRGGYHGQDYRASTPKPQGIKHVVRSTYRPRDVYATAVVDAYWK